MAYREVTMYEIKEVLRRWLRGASKSEIARQCGVARGTVRRYIAAGEASGLAPGQSALSDDLVAVLATKLHPNTGRPRGPSWGRCESHRGFIVKRVKAGIRLSKIRKLLRRQRDAKVSYATLWRFVTKDLGLRLGESPVPVSDGEPGKELQVDTGWVGYLSPDLLGRRRRFRAWIFTPVVSRSLTLARSGPLLLWRTDPRWERHVLVRSASGGVAVLRWVGGWRRGLW